MTLTILRRFLALAFLASFLTMAFVWLHGSRAPTAIFMDCNGNDATSGTFASPVKTFGRAHTLMGSTGRGTTYLRGNCAYPVSTNVWQYSNETYEGYPLDPPQSAEVDISTYNVGCSSCSNLAIRNLKIIGSNAATSMMQFTSTPTAPLNNIFIEANWIVDRASQPLIAYNPDNLYIRGNKFDVGTTQGNNALSTPFNDNTAHTNIFITDNVFINCARMCIESQQQGPYGSQPQISNVHIDRNVCNNCVMVTAGTFSFISAVTGPGTGSTLIGNSLSRATGTPCLGGIEVVTQNMTVTDNREVNVCWNYSIAHIQGSSFFNNWFTYDMTTTHAGFTIDGDYDHTEWIGSNNYNVGAGFVAVSGCPPNTSPSFCTLGFNSYGAAPTTTPASTPYVWQP
jgi:hypothetical protein